jgi:hypothetical protein
MEDDPFCLDSSSSSMIAQVDMCDVFELSSESSTPSSPRSAALSPPPDISEEVPVQLPPKSAVVVSRHPSPPTKVFRTSGSRPSSGSLDDAILYYLEDSLNDAASEFLSEFRFQLREALSFDSDVEAFTADLTNSIREVLNECGSKAEEEQPDCPRLHFPVTLGLPPEGDTCPDTWPDHGVIDDATADFNLRCKETLIDYRREMEQLQSLKAQIDETSIAKRDQLAALAADLEEFLRGYDPLSRFMQSKLLHLKQRESRFREVRCRQLHLAEESLFNADLSDLVVAAKQRSKGPLLANCEQLKSDVEQFRYDFEKLEDLIEYRLTESTRIARLKLSRQPPVQKPTS